MPLTKIRRIGNSAGIIIPFDFLKIMKLQTGSKVRLLLRAGCLHIGKQDMEIDFTCPSCHEESTTSCTPIRLKVQPGKSAGIVQEIFEVFCTNPRCSFKPDTKSSTYEEAETKWTEAIKTFQGKMA